MKKRLSYIDISRSLCMIWIIFFWHMQDYTYYNIKNSFTEILTYGTLAIFTFISGYCLGNSKIENFKDAKTFYMKRFFRIYPLYIISLTTLFIISIIFDIDYITSINQFILSIFGLSCIILPATKTIWYIEMILIFYLLTPIFKIVKEKWCIMISIILYIIIILLHIYLKIIDTRLLVLFPFYFMGLYLSKRNLFIRYNVLKIILSILVFIILFILLKDYKNMMIYKVILSAPILMIIMGTSKIMEKSKIITKIGKYIGVASMVLYLFHRQMFGFILFIIGKFNIIFVYIILLPCSIILSYYIQWLYNLIIKKIKV